MSLVRVDCERLARPAFVFQLALFPIRFLAFFAPAHGATISDGERRIEHGPTERSPDVHELRMQFPGLDAREDLGTEVLPDTLFASPAGLVAVRLGDRFAVLGVVR